MLRALLPNAMQRGADLWQTAQLAAQFSGGGHAGVGAANALRIQFAHAVRAKGYPAPALILGRELVIHCDRLRDLDAALAAGIDLGPLPMMAPLQTPAYVEGFSDEQ